ncbi:MAG: HEAT repeat domain-containing protein [Planctomycetota bacterium]|nr:HEAT repeat domain-containing protein [Planctomycetota bacterium]
MTDDLNELLNFLGGSDPDRSIEAAEELSVLGTDAQSAAVELVRAMANENEEVRELVAAALEELGPPPIEQLAELAGLLEDPHADVGYWAATLLGRLGETGKVVVPSLIDVAGNISSDLAVRQRAVWALGQIGRPAAAAIPVLEELAQNGENARLSRLAGAAIDDVHPVHRSQTLSEDHVDRV